MSPVQWAIRPFRRFADFSGRAPRAEYWWYRFGVGIIGFGLGLLDVLLLHGPIYGPYGILGLTFVAVCLIPTLAVLVRRLHDIERSGWWVLLEIPAFVLVATGHSPFAAGSLLRALPLGLNIAFALAWIGTAIVIFVFAVTPGTRGPNRYGRDPYGPDALEEVFA